MSLLGNLVGRGMNFEIPENPTLEDIQNAVAIIGMAAIGADGHFDRNEIVELKNSLISMPLYANVSAESAFGRAAKMFDKDRSLATTWGQGVCKNSGWAETAFVLMCSLVFSDGEIDAGEAKFVDEMQKTMNIDQEFAAGVANTYARLYRSR